MQPVERPEEVPSQKREDPAKPPHIKEEEEDVWSSQAAEKLPGPKEAEVTEFTWTGIHVKSENDEGQSSQLPHNPSEEASSQHWTPLSDMDDVMSHSSDTDHSDDDKEPLKTEKKSKGPHHSDGKHFDCSECGKTFTNKSVLKNHMVTHTGEKPFACSVCDKKFSLKHHVNRHMRIHTGEHPYSCSVCGKGFRDKFGLRSHMSKHTGQKPYSCPICAKGLSCNSSLRIHMRLHTEEKPFMCTVCGKGFSGSSSFSVHLRQHTGEKPFVCPICSKCFSRQETLTVHIKRHTESQQ